MQRFSALAVLLGCTILALRCNADDSKRLSVRVVAVYDPPSSFPFTPPSYRAASALTLTCLVDDLEDTSFVFYQWSSTLQQDEDAIVSTPYLHSYHSGVHSCTVYDLLGCTGNASITVNVVGAGVYVETGDGLVLPQNGLITTSTRPPNIRCLSGSSRSNVGNVIGPQGRDITNLRTDPFLVTRGRLNDRGTLSVITVRPLQQENCGIYTYRTPDESGNSVEVHFGLYLTSTAIAPYSSGLEYALTGNSLHKLTCDSHNTPPTQVVWEKDGQVIASNNTFYQFGQELVNRTTAAYSNSLTMNATFEEVVGDYACTVVNSVGSSERQTRSIEALEITGHEMPVIVGLSRNITCTTHLEVSRIEWVVTAVGNAISVGEGQSVTLPLSPEITGLDGAEFTCKIITTQGRSFLETIMVEIKELTNLVTISGSTSPLFTGGKNSLTCSIISDLSPTVKWLGPGNQEVGSSDPSLSVGTPVTNGNITTLVLNFDPIKASHAGIYACRSTISELNSVETDTRRVNVQLSINSVTVSQSPNSLTVFTATSLTLTCVTVASQANNIPIQVTHTWAGPGGVVSPSIAVRISAVTGSGFEYRSTLTFSSLLSSHSGTYTCSSTISPAQPSLYITTSAIETASASFTARVGHFPECRNTCHHHNTRPEL